MLKTIPLSPPPSGALDDVILGVPGGGGWYVNFEVSIMLRPSKGKLFVVKHGFSGRSRGGIFYPHTSKDAKNRKIYGRIIASGKDCTLTEGQDIVFNPLAGMELIGGDHFDIDRDGIPAVGFNAGSDERKYCIIDESEVIATVEDLDLERLL